MSNRRSSILSGAAWHHAAVTVLLPIVLSALLVSGCDDLLLSKEQRQVSAAVKQAVATDPSRINAPFLDGEPPLHVALSNQLPALFDWLLDHGADPNAPGRSGQTSLHQAVFHDVQDQRVLRALLKRGADVSRRDDHGETPLHLAAFLSHAASIEVLLAAGADPNGRDAMGETPLHKAATPQPTASPEDAARSIHLLVAGGSEVAARTTSGDPPLHRAALIGSVLATRTLLSEGAQVDLPGAGGGTALHVAAVFGRADVAEILLQAGAAPSRRDDRGLTPLGRALQFPAMTSRAQGAGPVETAAVVAVLRRFGAVGGDAPAVVQGDAGSEQEFERRLHDAELRSDADSKEVREAVAFLDDYLQDPGKYGVGALGAVEQARAGLVLFRLKPDSAIARSTLAELMGFVRESDDSAPDYLGIAKGLRTMGARAEPLYPALLLDALTDHDAENRTIAIGALSTITPSRQTLIANLKRIQVSSWETHRLIANIAQSDRELRSEIALALHHPAPSIRERAISVVGVIPGPDPIMLSGLERLTTDADARVRQKAVATWETLQKAR